MKVNLEILASVTVHRKKPWTKLAWIGKEKEKVLLLDKRKCSLFHFSSGKTKNNNKLNALMKNALYYTITTNGNYVIGLLQSANLFVWEKDSDNIWTVEGVGTLIPHELAEQNVYVFANELIENILLVIKFKQIFLWERSDPNEVLNPKQSFLTGMWTTITLDSNILLPIPDAKDPVICSAFINNLISGKQCMCSFIFTYNNNICISTVQLKKTYQIHASNVPNYGARWHLRNIPCNKLGTTCQAVNCNDAYIALYSNQADILTVAVNQRNSFNSRILFLSSLSSAFVVSDLKGCGASSDSAANQRRNFIADMKWVIDDSFLVCVTHQGNFFLLTRLGDILKLSAQGCDMDIAASHFLSLHTYIPSRPSLHISDKHNNEDVLTVSNTSIENRMQHFSITSHPHLPLVLCSDGFTITCLMIPSALVNPTNIVEFLIVESSITFVKLRKRFNLKNVSFKLCRSSSKKTERSNDATRGSESADNCSEDQSVTYSHLTPLETVDDASFIQIEKEVMEFMEPSLSFKFLQIPEMKSAIKTLLAAVGFCASNKSIWNEKWEILSTNIIQQLLKACNTIFLISLGNDRTNAEVYWKNPLHVIHVILLKCINLLHFDVEQQNLLAFGLKVIVEIGKKLITMAEKKLKKMSLFWLEVFSIISSLELELASVYQWKLSLEAVYCNSEISSSHSVYENSICSFDVENRKDLTTRINRLTMQKFTGFWKFFYKKIVNYFSSLNGSIADNEMENYFSLLCSVQKKLLFLDVPINLKNSRNIKRVVHKLFNMQDIKVISVDERFLKLIKKVNLRSARKLKRQFLSLLYTLLHNYNLLSAMEFTFKLIANEIQKSTSCSEETTDKEMPVISANPVVKSVALNLARFMSYYFTNQQLSILPPHKSQSLPSISNKIAPTESLSLSREKIQSVIKMEPLSFLWTPETTLGLFVKCGALAEAATFANKIGDWKSSLILSTICEEASKIYLHILPKARSKPSLALPQELKPSAVLLNKVVSLLGIEDNWMIRSNDVVSNTNENSVKILDGAKKISEYLKEINRSSKPVIVILTEYITACIMYGFDVVPILIDQLLEQLLSLIQSLPFDIHKDFPLPVPPVFCPQDNSEGIATCEDESVKRNAISFIIQLILIVLKSSNLLIPLAYSYAVNIINMKNDEDFTSFHEAVLQPFYHYKNNNQINLFSECEYHSAILKLKESFADFCMLTWIMHIRDTLQTEYRKMWNIIEKLPPFTNSEKYSKQCLSVLKWCKQLLPFAEFMDWKVKLCEIALTVALESPPSVQVAKIFAECYPDITKIPSECSCRMDLLIKKWEKIAFRSKSLEKIKDNTKTSQRMLLSDYFKEQCQNALLKLPSYLDDDKEKTLKEIRYLHENFEPSKFFFEFLIVFLDVTVHKDMDEYHTVSILCPLLTANSEILQDKEFSFLPEDKFDAEDEIRSTFGKSFDLLENQMHYVLSELEEKNPKPLEETGLSHSVSDSELSKNSPKIEKRKKRSISSDNLKKIESKQEVLANKSVKKTESALSISKLNSSFSFQVEARTDHQLIVSKIQVASSRLKYDLSLKIKQIVWLGYWMKRIQLLNSPLALCNQFPSSQIRLQITLQQILSVILAVCMKASSKCKEDMQIFPESTEFVKSRKKKLNKSWEQIANEQRISEGGRQSLSEESNENLQINQAVDPSDENVINRHEQTLKLSNDSESIKSKNSQTQNSKNLSKQSSKDKKNGKKNIVAQFPTLSSLKEEHQQSLSSDFVSDYKDLKCEVSCSTSNLFKKHVDLQKQISSESNAANRTSSSKSILSNFIIKKEKKNVDENFVEELGKLIEQRDFGSVMERLNSIQLNINSLDKIPQMSSNDDDKPKHNSDKTNEIKEELASSANDINENNLSENCKTYHQSNLSAINTVSSRNGLLNVKLLEKSVHESIKHSISSVLSNKSKANTSTLRKKKIYLAKEASYMSPYLLEDTLNDVSSPSSMQILPTEFCEPENNLSIKEQVNFVEIFQDKNLGECQLPKLNPSKEKELNLPCLPFLKSQSANSKKDESSVGIPHFLRLTAEKESNLISSKVPENEIWDDAEDRLRGGGSRKTTPFPLLQLPPPQFPNSACNNSQQSFSTNLIHVQPSCVTRGLPLLKLPEKYKVTETRQNVCCNFDENPSPCRHNIYIQDKLHKYWEDIQNSTLHPHTHIYANLPVQNESKNYLSNRIPNLADENFLRNNSYLISSERMDHISPNVSLSNAPGITYVNSTQPSQNSGPPLYFDHHSLNGIPSFKERTNSNDLASNSVQVQYNPNQQYLNGTVAKEAVPGVSGYSDCPFRQPSANGNSFITYSGNTRTTSPPHFSQLPLCHFHCLRDPEAASFAQKVVQTTRPEPGFANAANVPVCDFLEGMPKLVLPCSKDDAKVLVQPCPSVDVCRSKSKSEICNSCFKPLKQETVPTCSSECVKPSVIRMVPFCQPVQTTASSVDHVPSCKSMQIKSSIVQPCDSARNIVCPCKSMNVPMCDENVVSVCESRQPITSVVPPCESNASLISSADLRVPPCASKQVMTSVKDTVPVCKSVQTLDLPSEPIRNCISSTNLTVPPCKSVKMIDPALDLSVRTCSSFWKNEDAKTKPSAFFSVTQSIEETFTSSGQSLLVPKCKSSEFSVPVCKSQVKQYDYVLPCSNEVQVCKSINEVAPCSSDFFNTNNVNSNPALVPTCQLITSSAPCHESSCLKESLGGREQTGEKVLPCPEQRCISLKNSYDSHESILRESPMEVPCLSTVEQKIQTPCKEGIVQSVTSNLPYPNIVDVHSKVIKELEEQKRLLEGLQTSTKCMDTKSVQTVLSGESSTKVPTTTTICASPSSLSMYGRFTPPEKPCDDEFTQNCIKRLSAEQELIKKRLSELFLYGKPVPGFNYCTEPSHKLIDERKLYGRTYNESIKSRCLSKSGTELDELYGKPSYSELKDDESIFYIEDFDQPSTSTGIASQIPKYPASNEELPDFENQIKEKTYPSHSFCTQSPPVISRKNLKKSNIYPSPCSSNTIKKDNSRKKYPLSPCAAAQTKTTKSCVPCPPKKCGPCAKWKVEDKFLKMYRARKKKPRRTSEQKSSPSLDTKSRSFEKLQKSQLITQTILPPVAEEAPCLEQLRSNSSQIKPLRIPLVETNFVKCMNCGACKKLNSCCPICQYDSFIAVQNEQDPSYFHCHAIPVSQRQHFDLLRNGSCLKTDEKCIKSKNDSGTDSFGKINNNPSKNAEKLSGHSARLYGKQPMMISGSCSPSYAPSLPLYGKEYKNRYSNYAQEDGLSERTQISEEIPFQYYEEFPAQEESKYEALSEFKYDVNQAEINSEQTPETKSTQDICNNFPELLYSCIKDKMGPEFANNLMAAASQEDDKSLMAMFYKWFLQEMHVLAVNTNYDSLSNRTNLNGPSTSSSKNFDESNKNRQTSGQDLVTISSASYKNRNISQEINRNEERVEQMEILNADNEAEQGNLIKNAASKNDSHRSEFPHPVHHLLSSTRTELLPKIIALNNVQKKLQGLQENCRFIEKLSQNLQLNFQNNEQILHGISINSNTSQNYEQAVDDRKIKLEEFKFLKDLQNVVIDPKKSDNSATSEILLPNRSKILETSKKPNWIETQPFVSNSETLHDTDKHPQTSEETFNVQISPHKRTNQVTFIKSNQVKNIVPSSTNEASRPSDADSMLTNRKWESLKQTIRESKSSISQGANAEAPSPSKSRFHARQIQKSHHFKLRLQEACHLMDDLMSTQPECINSAPTVSGTSSPSPPPLKSQRKWKNSSSNRDLDARKQRTTWTENDTVLQNGNNPNFDKLKSNNATFEQTKSKPPRRKLVTLKNGLTGKRRKLGIKSSSVNNSNNNDDLDKPSRTVSMGQDIHVASTIAEISEETQSSNKPKADKPSLTLPLYKKAPRRLVVRMTRAAALRKKLTLAKINSNVSISEKPPKSKIKKLNKENVLSPQLVQTPRVYDENIFLRRAVNITSYTDRLKGLQNKTDSDLEKLGSPLNSFISDVSSPSTWEVGEDIRVILYGNDSITEFLENSPQGSDKVESE